LNGYEEKMEKLIKQKMLEKIKYWHDLIEDEWEGLIDEQEEDKTIYEGIFNLIQNQPEE
jgi:hypothetical protein